MATVQSTGKCPQCGNKKAIYELSTNSLEESLYCFLCGYTWESKSLVDRKKQRKDLKHREWYKFNKHGQIIFRIHKKKGYGAYHITGKEGIGECGRFSKPITKKMIKEFMKVLLGPQIDIKKSYLTRWNPKTRKVERIIGKPRGLF